MNSSDLKQRTILVLGAGKTGIATAKFLANKCKKILLSESQKSISSDIAQSLLKLGIETESGKHSEEFINKSDLVVVSPGISPQSEVIKKINSKNIPLTSDIELAKYYIKSPIIAVTGTNGKTTTTSLISHIINNSGKKAVSCGNIGKPLIELANEDIRNVDYFVLEISSFQIYYSPNLSCEIAVCMNITPDHLDWHGSFEHYLETKKRLFTQQKKDSWAVLNSNDKFLKDFNLNNNLFHFSSDISTINNIKQFENFAYYKNNSLLVNHKNKTSTIINKNDLQIIGTHNIENALASIAVSKIINIKDESIKSGLESFKGVEHRLEYIKDINGKSFYNDSKATNPEATIKAIEAFKDKQGRKITLILGGRDKNTDLNEMVTLIKSFVSEVILYGEAKERFKKELDTCNYNKAIIVNDLNEAVTTSSKLKSDIVLFSPACSSFDMFKNYEERGKLFKELVSKL